MELVTLLSSLVDSSGHALVRGFYDNVRPPDAQEVAQLAKAAEGWDMDKYLDKLGVQKLLEQDAETVHMHAHLTVLTITQLFHTLCHVWQCFSVLSPSVSIQHAFCECRSEYCSW